MDKYIIQSNDNQQFELTVEQINKYPLLMDTLLDIDIEPGTIFDIPFSAELLTIAFNDNYNQAMALDRLVTLIQLVSYLGLENEVNKLLKTLISYFNLKFTAPQVEMIKNIINTFDAIMQQLFVSKTQNLTTDYHSSLFLTDNQYTMQSISATVLVTSANLDYTLVKHTSIDQRTNLSKQNYSIWRGNEVTITKIPEKSENIMKYHTLFDIYSMYISNDGKYYELVKHKDGDITTYDISLLSNNEQVIHTIPIPNYTESKEISYVVMSLDLFKYMIYYDLPPGELDVQKMFIGSVADPHEVVSIDIIRGFRLSPLFNTILSIRSDIDYTIYHIENNQVFSKLVNYYRSGWLETELYPNFYFSYDGKMIAEVNGDSVHILNYRGDSFVKRDMPQDEKSVAITNEYLITYNRDSHELHFWYIYGLSEAIKPSLKINVIYGKDISPNISYGVYDVRVIMGENNTFLLTRNVIKTIKRNKEMFFEWTKYKIQPYTTMDQFYASLTD